MTVGVIWVEKYEKIFWYLKVTYWYLLSAKSDWISLTVSIGKTLIWHQEGKGVLYLSSTTWCWKVQHQKFIDCKTAYCLLHGEQQDLKNAKYKDKESTYWCFSYNYFLASIWISANARSRDVALHHHSWWDFPSHFSMNSQLCTFCFLILYTT